MNLFEVRTEFFRPIARRVIIAVIFAVWTVVEALSGAYAWAGLFGLATAYLFWAFFIAFEQGPAGRDAED